MTTTRTKIENTVEAALSKAVVITDQDQGLESEDMATNPIKDILLPSIGCTGKLLLVSLNAKILTFTAENVLGLPKQKKH
jgi:hypothetical protein